MISAPSFGSDTDDDVPPALSKKQRVGSFSGFAQPSPLGQFSAAPHGCAALRPPPIRTMTSLEGPEFMDVISAIPASKHSDSAPPPTPAAGLGTRGSSFRGSRLAAPPMSLVAPSLYIGDEVSAASEPRLRLQGITHVLNCTSKPNPTLEAARAEGGKEGPSPLGYLRLNLLDCTADLPRMQSVLREGVNFIRKALVEGGTVLVHCHRGISRSCTLVMAYLIESEQRLADSVFEGIRAKRRICDPNLGYWCALQEWERSVLTAPRLIRQRSASRASPHPLAPSPRPLSRAG